MSRQLKIYIASILTLVVLIFLIDSLREKPTNWTPTYKLDFKNPFDLYIFNREIKQIIPEKRLTRVLVTPYEYINSHPEKANYLLIKQHMYNSGDSILLDEVYKGSNLFVSAENFVRIFTDSLGLNYTEADSEISLEKLNQIKLTLSNKAWNNDKLVIKPVINTFAFVDADADRTTILGTQQFPSGKVYPNFLRIKHGKGFIFIHNQPQVFSNEALLNQGSSAYVARILSYLPSTLPVVWFVQGQTYDKKAPTDEAKNALTVVFRYPALRAAWLILVYGLLMYILFHSKRKQRIVPVIKPLQNTTVEFVQTIANLYFQQKNYSNIFEKKIIYFLEQVRTNYLLDTSKLDQRFVERLTKKSGKDLVLINKLIDFINQFKKNKTASKSDLILFNKQLETFWEIKAHSTNYSKTK